MVEKGKLRKLALTMAAQTVVEGPSVGMGRWPAPVKEWPYGRTLHRTAILCEHPEDGATLIEQ